MIDGAPILIIDHQINDLVASVPYGLDSRRLRWMQIVGRQLGEDGSGVCRLML